MRVLLLNDTRVEENPGCHVTVAALLRFIEETLPESTVETLPLGAEYENFSTPRLYLARNNASRFTRGARWLMSRVRPPAPWEHHPPAIDYAFWRERHESLLSPWFKDRVDASDLVVVNMEGTMHHNSVGGVVLLSMARYCKGQGKPVFMVNGSYQAMSARMTREVLPAIDFLSVRDPRSRACLAAQGVQSLLIPDFAWRTPLRSGHRTAETATIPTCLYTPGVLGAYPDQHGGLSTRSICKHAAEIRKSGLEPTYFRIERRESRIEEALSQTGVASLRWEPDSGLNRLGAIIGGHDLIITGRYHIGILGILSGITTLFLPSNTYKTEGMLEFLGAEGRLLRRPLTAARIARFFQRTEPLRVNADELESLYHPLRVSLREAGRCQAS